MKLTKARLKQIILEEINEMRVTDIAGDDEDRAIDAHRRAKRARGEYPRRPTGGYEDTRCPAEIEQARKEGMVEATRNILEMFPGGGLMVDQNTYNAIQEMAPELLDRISVTRSRRREQ